MPLEIAEAAFATRTEPGLGAGSGTSTTCVFPPRRTTCFTALRVSGSEGRDRAPSLSSEPNGDASQGPLGRRHAAEHDEDRADRRGARAALATSSSTCSSTRASTTTARCPRSSSRSSASASPTTRSASAPARTRSRPRAVMERLEPVLLEAEPDVVLVPGDVNSTMAAALTAAKLLIPIGHVEAGLRSFDRTMPEEINRIVADRVSELLFIHSPEARDNLLAEGCPATAIHDVGNTMIDTLVAMRGADRGSRSAGGARPAARRVPRRHAAPARARRRPAARRGDRRSSRRSRRSCRSSSRFIPGRAPRSRRSAIDLGLDRLRLLDPLGYLEFLSLVAGSAGVLTDSGGIQEETTFLGLPCFTLRANTERPITVTMGTNTLLGPRSGADRRGAGAAGRGAGARRRRSRRSGTARRRSGSSTCSRRR